MMPGINKVMNDIKEESKQASKNMKEKRERGGNNERVIKWDPPSVRNETS